MWVTVTLIDCSTCVCWLVSWCVFDFVDSTGCTWQIHSIENMCWRRTNPSQCPTLEPPSKLCPVTAALNIASDEDVPSEGGEVSIPPPAAPMKPRHHHTNQAQSAAQKATTGSQKGKCLFNLPQCLLINSQMILLRIQMPEAKSHHAAQMREVMRTQKEAALQQMTVKTIALRQNQRPLRGVFKMRYVFVPLIHCLPAEYMYVRSASSLVGWR